MKSTGIVRKLDNLGRVVIPKELRQTMQINEGDALEILVGGDKIVLRKYSPYQACMITGEVSMENLSLLNGKIVISPKGAKQLLDALEKNEN